MNTIYQEQDVLSCPTCESEALYRNGHAHTGKQRFVCLMCGLQFTIGAKKQISHGKPLCTHCGKKMHLYRIDGESVHFRCSGYPTCKSFRKFRMVEEKEKT